MLLVEVLSSPALTLATAPTTSVLRMLWYPTTTSSWRECRSSCKVKTIRLAALMVWEVKPMYETWISPPLPSIFNKNFPSTSVTTALRVPFSTTLAPTIGSPWTSLTMPVTWPTAMLSSKLLEPLSPFASTGNNGKLRIIFAARTIFLSIKIKLLVIKLCGKSTNVVLQRH